MSAETIVPIGEYHEALGLAKPKIVPAHLSQAINLTVLDNVDPGPARGRWVRVSQVAQVLETEARAPANYRERPVLEALLAAFCEAAGHVRAGSAPWP